jgi:hypothetical protein
MSEIDYTENENYSKLVKSQLPFLIRDGFLMIVSGIITVMVIFFLEWNSILFLLPIVLLVFGLIELIVAWHIRQGLLYGRFVRRAIAFILMFKLKKLKHD